ncbi:PREDICTED: heat stress transcription factor B-3-like [Ipomoea nil]|uniref:heat stress transcription factor B-3-like n=1 Tax=Ipomoea nil TaxID=35883 RepID=UPI000900B59B|nr:PREDICTED: heat stress transcription factor B-3-like [Ipomoea nil]
MLVLGKDSGEKSSNGEDRAQPRAAVSPTPFVRKTYAMVENHQTDGIVSWNSTGNGFVIWDAHKFAAEILPCYFKHNTFSSYICQLNTYGFKKVSWERYEFHHEWFRKGRKRWLKNIRRRRSGRTDRPARSQDHQQHQQNGEEMSVLRMEKEIEEMQGVQREILMEIKRLQEQQEILAKELVGMIKNAPSLGGTRRQLPKIMAESLLESISELDNSGVVEEKEIYDPNGKIPEGEEEDEEVQKDTREMARLETYDGLNMEKLVEERPDIVIGLDDLFEGPVDWRNYIKQLGEKATDNLRIMP